MLRQLLVSTAVSLGNIAIHAMVMAALLRVVRHTSERVALDQTFGLAAVMMATVTVLMTAHIAEVFAWSLAYGIIGAAPDGADLFYFAFVNYATLGYGDVTPVKRWSLIGPMTALNGALLVGWSTAVMFEVLRRAMASSRPGEMSRR